MTTLDEQVSFVRKLRTELAKPRVTHVRVKKNQLELLMAIEKSVETTYELKHKSVRVRLVRLICLFYECTHEQLVGEKKNQAIVNARKAYACIARHTLHDGLAKIGEALKRDHSVIINLLERAEDDAFMKKYNTTVIKQIEQQLLNPTI